MMGDIGTRKGRVGEFVVFESLSLLVTLLLLCTLLLIFFIFWGRSLSPIHTNSFERDCNASAISCPNVVNHNLQSDSFVLFHLILSHLKIELN